MSYFGRFASANVYVLCSTVYVHSPIPHVCNVNTLFSMISFFRFIHKKRDPTVAQCQYMLEFFSVFHLLFSTLFAYYISCYVLWALTIIFRSIAARSVLMLKMHSKTHQNEIKTVECNTMRFFVSLCHDVLSVVCTFHATFLCCNHSTQTHCTECTTHRNLCIFVSNNSGNECYVIFFQLSFVFAHNFNVRLGAQCTHRILNRTKWCEQKMREEKWIILYE